MNDELLMKAMLLFDTNEKWESFSELMNINGNIQAKWWKKLQTEIYNREVKKMMKIGVFTFGIIGIYFGMLKGYSEKSLAIHFWGDGFRIFSDYGDLDPEKVNELVKHPRFDSIRNAFSRIDSSNNETIALEIRNFSFGTSFDENFPNSRSLSWFAGNKTNEFADQLIEKVRKLQTKEIVELFKEINNTCKKLL
ncbi:hypothetical protein [Chryseobacterium indoltheticum]|uniref:hypothetical protein n=1 Tax=Chryseobacterium indoltheticum TaxID=254 RepID=UPI003F494AFB